MLPPFNKALARHRAASVSFSEALFDTSVIKILARPRETRLLRTTTNSSSLQLSMTRCNASKYVLQKRVAGISSKHKCVYTEHRIGSQHCDECS